ncbi:MAG: hypothetical protein M1823_000983 [Watsoniomyces obsoletus]|nr:MAG: hypothetical protein M1823_000983 [Watsoniomyces obsoletus]
MKQKDLTIGEGIDLPADHKANSDNPTESDYYWQSLTMDSSDGEGDAQKQATVDYPRYAWKDLSVGHQLSLIDAMAERAKVTFSEGYPKVFSILGLDPLEQEQAMHHLRERAANLEKENKAIPDLLKATTDWLMGPARVLSSSDRRGSFQNAIQQKLYRRMAEDQEQVSTKGELAVARAFAAQIGLEPDVLGRWGRAVIDVKAFRPAPEKDASEEAGTGGKAQEGKAQASDAMVKSPSPMMKTPSRMVKTPSPMVKTPSPMVKVADGETPELVSIVPKSEKNQRGGPATRGRGRGYRRAGRGRQTFTPSGLRICHTASGADSLEPTKEATSLVLQLSLSPKALRAISGTSKVEKEESHYGPTGAALQAPGQTLPTDAARSKTMKAPQAQDSATGSLPVYDALTVKPLITSPRSSDGEEPPIRGADPLVVHAAGASMSVCRSNSAPIKKPREVMGLLSNVLEDHPTVPQLLPTAPDSDLSAGTTDIRPKRERRDSTASVPGTGGDASSSTLEEATPSPTVATLVTPIVIHGRSSSARGPRGRGTPRGPRGRGSTTGPPSASLSASPSASPRGNLSATPSPRPAGRGRGRPRGGRGPLTATAGTPPAQATVVAGSPRRFSWGGVTMYDESPAASVKRRTNRKRKILSP